MNIILCYPPKRNYPGYGQDKRWLPLGIASVGAYVKRELPNVDIKLLDLFEYPLHEAWAEIQKYLIPYDTNVIGFTCFTEQRFSTFELCELAKKDLNGAIEIITVIGGPHAFLMADQISGHYPYIDHIIKGEGERSFTQLINNIISGVECKRIIESDPILNLDSLPHAIDGFGLFANVPKEIEAEAPIIFSRGCTDYCSFCSTTKFWKGYRSRSAENVFDEMLKYHTQFGTKKFKFHDDASTADIVNWKTLCKFIYEFEFNWEFEITARADQFDDELIALLQLAGCKRVAVGIESGNAGLREAMNKKLDIELAKDNIRKLMHIGIEVVGLFIIGYPGESEETINDTIAFIREVRLTSFCCQPLMILPGTKVYRNCVSWDWIHDDYWLQDQPQPYYTRENGMEKLQEWSQKVLTCMKFTKILICAPVHEDRNIFELYIESLRGLELPDLCEITKVFIFHNCSDKLGDLVDENRLEAGFAYDNEVPYSKDENTHNWSIPNFRDVINMKNKLLEIMMGNGYDYIFFVDSDLILHPKTLKQLFDADKDMVSEIFWTKWAKEDKVAMPNCWMFDHYSFNPGDIEKWKEPGLYQVGMTGACTLIKRKVIEAGVTWSPVRNVHCAIWEDRAFCIRAEVLGFDIYTDTHYPATHLYRQSEVEKYLEECENSNGTITE